VGVGITLTVADEITSHEKVTVWPSMSVALNFLGATGKPAMTIKHGNTGPN